MFGELVARDSFRAGLAKNMLENWRADVKMELKDFYNDGFGWVCRQCERDLAPTRPSDESSRLLREGESESKSPQLSNLSLARWEDAAQRVLVCPRCGVSESVEKS